MSKSAPILIITARIASAEAFEPFQVALADVEKSTYPETLHTANGDVKPERSIAKFGPS